MARGYEIRKTNVGKLGLKLFFLVCVLTSPCFSQDYLLRNWKNASGKFSVDAQLESIEDDKVKLRKQDNRVVTVPVASLSKPDVEFVTALKASEENREQFNKLESHLARLSVSPTAVNEVIQQLHDDSELAFAAGLYSSVFAAYFSNKNEFEKAQRTLGNVILRLNNIRKVMPEYQTTALVSALNNRAVMQIRMLKPDSAASSLIQAAQLTPQTPFVVYHNATLLLQVSAVPNSRLEIGSSYRTKLRQVIAKGEPQGPGLKIPERFMYTFAHDNFGCLLKPNDIHAKTKIVVEEVLPPEPGMAIKSYGSGFLIAPNLVMTNRHVWLIAINLQHRYSIGFG